MGKADRNGPVTVIVQILEVYFDGFKIFLWLVFS